MGRLGPGAGKLPLQWESSPDDAEDYVRTMPQEQTRPLDEFAAPYGRQVAVQEVIYDNGFALLRLRIREGRRFTIMEVDAATARRWGELMVQWARRQPGE